MYRQVPARRDYLEQMGQAKTTRGFRKTAKPLRQGKQYIDNELVEQEEDEQAGTNDTTTK
eukprot:m.37890 g.37890  ORF g.37890 m.37890 type:complete len:60 (-) comp11140_c0_seq3:99-278(-)